MAFVSSHYLDFASIERVFANPCSHISLLHNLTLSKKLNLYLNGVAVLALIQETFIFSVVLAACN